MKSLTGKILMVMATTLAFARPSAAEDIDLFTSSSAAATSAPNILIVLDNSANWARNDQQWAIGKQGQAELYALYQIMADNTNFNTPVNIGLMMFNTNNGGSVRFAIRPMGNADPNGPTNRAAFRELIGTDTDPNFGGAACTDGANSLNGTPNCILKNFNGSEKVNSASTNYSGGLFEAFKYFGGYTDPAHANLDVAGTPTNSTHFGPQVYTTQSSSTTDRAAYSGSGTSATWNGPITTADSCAKNYIIFIGNGYPSQDADVSLITGINGSGTVPAPIGNKSNRAANWAKYLNTTDVSSVLGRQYVTTFAIDVFNAHPDNYQTPLMEAMAKYGGGQYFAARDNNAILQAFKDILVQIQAVNSVFASASLPINATNRTQNANQVFIGVFRPDPNAKPRWYGNLKQFQIALIAGTAQLADSLGKSATSSTTGFIQPCAVSFWTTDSGNYWSFSAPSAGTCTSVANSTFSDYPDGAVVEKGGVAEMLRKGNAVGAVAPYTVNRTVLTCTDTGCPGGLQTLNTTTVPASRTGAATTTLNQSIVDFTNGKDVGAPLGDDNADGSTTDPRPSIHGDLVHSRPLPINFGGARGVELYYGANGGAFRAVSGATGRELWSFVAPEHHTKLARLYNNSPLISYYGLSGLGLDPAPQPKDYFFDGSIGVFQNADNSKVWIFPSMRRGGRMIYAFNVTNSGSPTFMWAKGCPHTTDDLGCSAGMSQMGLTFSTPSVALVKGYSGGGKPIIVVGGGYDTCEDNDAAVTTCTSSNKGNVVYVLDAEDGSILQQFPTSRAVASDPTFIDRNFDGLVDHAYIMDVGGSLYRLDFIVPSTKATLDNGNWTMTKIAQTTGGNRKFLFGPSALAALNEVFLAIGSGDRERPLIQNYPYTTPVQNRFYMFVDKFLTSGLPVDLDGSTMSNFTTNTSCATTFDSAKNGWFMDLTAGTGEQTVTSSVIFGGTVFFSTNRPLAPTPGTCAANLGEARGYAVNLLTASGVIGTGSTCGGSRSGVFTGGGIPPSPVVGTVPVVQADGTTKSTSIIIGGIDLLTGGGCAICAQPPIVPVKQIRQRLYWYPDGDK